VETCLISANPPLRLEFTFLLPVECSRAELSDWAPFGRKVGLAGDRDREGHRSASPADFRSAAVRCLAQGIESDIPASLDRMVLYEPCPTQRVADAICRCIKMEDRKISMGEGDRGSEC
jgi:hypothetical protein